MPDRLAEARKAVTEAVTQAYKGWVDAWEQSTEIERKIARRAFLAGVRWAQREKEKA
jgi:hypothetical protein